jgi:putative DNA primase/helicase
MTTWMLGDYATSAPMSTFTASHTERHPTELAGLWGARMVTAVETQQGRKWDEPRIKALTGGDKISARFMRQDFFEFVPKFKLVIAGNHKPGLRSVDEAIRRRLHLIPFTVTIPDAERDQNLGEKLKAEWPGILAWAIEGCQLWQQRGLSPPEVVTAATGAYLDAEDAIACWLEEECILGPNRSESRKSLFASWKTGLSDPASMSGARRRSCRA